MVDLDRDQLQKDIIAMYTREHEALGDTGTHDHLMRGIALAEKYNLTEIVGKGGVLVFPHIAVQDCGYQVAACAHAALQSVLSGMKKRVVAISVLHAFTQDMEDARRRVAADNANLENEPLRGIQGTGLNVSQAYTKDHALMSWRHFWNAALQHHGVSSADVSAAGVPMDERYPYLAGGHPETLPGIEELRELVKDAAIVSTADAFHHGIGYGDAPENSFDHDAEGLARAQAVIEEGMDILGRGDYWGYNGHCVEAKSDARDAGQVFRYLRGEMRGRVVDMSYSDATELYNAVPPTWVAGALMVWELV